MEKFNGGGGCLFDYNVSPEPFIWEFDTNSVNMKVKKVCWWWGGGLFDYSVTPGPFIWEFDTKSVNMKVRKV